MLVDNSVVITESVFRHRQMEPDRPVEATIAGVREVGIATLAGTISTVIVFLPLVFGEKNQMSLFLVHVAVPIVVADAGLAGRRPDADPDARGTHVASPPVAEASLFGRLQRRYTRTLAWAMDHPKTMGVVTLMLLLSPVPLFALKLAKVDPFPQEASRTLFLSTISTAPTRWTASSRRCGASRPTSRKTRSASTSRRTTRSGSPTRLRPASISSPRRRPRSPRPR